MQAQVQVIGLTDERTRVSVSVKGPI